MKEKFKNLLDKVSGVLRCWCGAATLKLKESYMRCRAGEERLNVLLYYWCVIPCVIYLVVVFKLKSLDFIRNIFNVFALALTILDYYFIAKAVRVHPEYDTEATEELEKERYYASLSDEEFKKVVKQEKIENRKNCLKRLFLAKSGKRADFYKIVRIFVVLIFLVSLKNLFF
jgi:uncharacterized membrane protein